MAELPPPSTFKGTVPPTTANYCCCQIPTAENTKNESMAALKATLKAILIDISGTLHIENYVIPGAIEALNRLRQTNIPIKFVTNTTKESRRCLYQRLINLGFIIEEHEIYSSLWAARDLIVARGLNPFLLVDDAALEDFAVVTERDKEDYNSVVVGLAPEKFNYEFLNKAFTILCKKGTPLIAIHEGRYYKRPDGLALGPGPFVKGLEYATECKSEVVGKPSANFFIAALGDLDPETAVMIGDDVRDDIAGAQSLGMRGFLVQTGKYRPGDEETIVPKPYKTCQNFAEAVEVLIGEINAN